MDLHWGWMQSHPLPDGYRVQWGRLSILQNQDIKGEQSINFLFFFLLGHACCDFFAFPDFPDFTGCEVCSCSTEAHQSPREVSPKMEEKEKQEQ